MLQIEDPNVLTGFEEAEKATPSHQENVNAERTIYGSRELRPPKNRAYGPPVLCDFGEARLGSSHKHLEIQPTVYKAPEVLMQCGWGHSIDIWNLACVVSEPKPRGLLLLIIGLVALGHARSGPSV